MDRGIFRIDLGRLSPGRLSRFRRRVKEILFGTVFAQVQIFCLALAKYFRDVIRHLFRTPLAFHAAAPLRLNFTVPA